MNKIWIFCIICLLIFSLIIILLNYQQDQKTVEDANIVDNRVIMDVSSVCITGKESVCSISKKYGFDKIKKSMIPKNNNSVFYIDCNRLTFEDLPNYILSESYCEEYEKRVFRDYKKEFFELSEFGIVFCNQSMLLNNYGFLMFNENGIRIIDDLGLDSKLYKNNLNVCNKLKN